MRIMIFGVLMVTACTPAVAEDTGGSTGEPEASDSTGSTPNDGTSGTGSSSGGEVTTVGMDASGGTTLVEDSSSGGSSTDGPTTGEASESSTTGAPLPEGCEEHLALEISALSIEPEGPTWEAGEAVTVVFSLHNPADVDDTGYPSVYVEADTDGVESRMPIFSWFAIVAGETYDGSLVFDTPASLAPGTEVEFTAHVATLDGPCLGVGTRTATATVQ